MNYYKIILENEDFYFTGFNGTLEEAEDYFLNKVQYSINELEDGTEIKTKIINVLKSESLFT